MNICEAIVIARAETERLAPELYSNGWRWSVSNKKRALGSCHYGEKVLYLSGPLTEANEEPEVLDTIRHELAHAVAGPAARHGPQWRAQARAFGARPQATTSTAISVPAPYSLVCVGCGAVLRGSVHRRSKAMLNSHHVPCGRERGRLRYVRN